MSVIKFTNYNVLEKNDNNSLIQNCLPCIKCHKPRSHTKWQIKSFNSQTSKKEYKLLGFSKVCKCGFKKGSGWHVILHF